MRLRPFFVDDRRSKVRCLQLLRARVHRRVFCALHPFLMLMMGLFVGSALSVAPEALLLRVSTTEAATVKKLSIDQLTKLSTLIFRGRVSASETREMRDGSLWTQTTFEVIDVWKGDPREVRAGSEWTLNARGGELGAGITWRKQVIHGAPTFTIGEEVLLMIERSSRGTSVITGLAQGKYTLSKRAQVTWAERDLEALEFQRSTQGLAPYLRFQFGWGLSRENALPLSELYLLVSRSLRGVSKSIHKVSSERYSPQLIPRPTLEGPSSTDSLRGDR